jgi:hypothetical protein
MTKVKKANPNKLVVEMAKQITDEVNYIGIEAPSDNYRSIEEILGSYVDQKRAEALRKKFNKMTYGKVMKLEEKINDLLC